MPLGEFQGLDECSKIASVNEFTLLEIEEALHETDKSKAPGPDGINAGVLSHIWPTIKTEVLLFFQLFHETGQIPTGLNSSFIALILKSGSATTPAEFRPISLMNALMKLLTKVLARRLKNFMPGLVGPTQSAFIKGRQISDSIILANEFVDALKSRKSSSLILKLDFEKAFDCV